MPSYKDWRIGLAAAMVSDALQRLLRGRDRRQLHRGLVHGHAEHARAVCSRQNNRYKNPFGTEIALFRTSEGGMARMAVSWDTPGDGGEMGRIRGQRGSFYGKYEGLEKNLPPVGASAAAARRRSPAATAARTGR